MKYEFINKAVFFPKEKILAIGDLHIGYEFTIRETGSLTPATQFDEMKKDFEIIFKNIKTRFGKINKVIFLGDIKHFFAYMKAEKNLFLELLIEITKYIPRDDIILLKGNHEKMAKIADKELVDYYIEGELAFIHGDAMMLQAFDKKIKRIVMGHLHPAITLKDSQNIKAEKYKCYLTGKYKGKEIIILPSFLPIVTGASVNDYLGDDRCIIPARSLKNFNVHIIGKDEVLDFGILKNL